ncbi:MAG: hypothetical protein KDJ90_18475 [Nitratireductor sp.]|nr:hypothetical protein [Nitratireductor sp.]
MPGFDHIPVESFPLCSSIDDEVGGSTGAFVEPDRTAQNNSGARHIRQESSKAMEKVLFALTFIALFTSFAFENCIEDRPVDAAE